MVHSHLDHMVFLEIRLSASPKQPFGKEELVCLQL